MYRRNTTIVYDEPVNPQRRRLMGAALALGAGAALSRPLAAARGATVLGVIDADRPASRDAYARFVRAIRQRGLIERFGVRPVFIPADQTIAAELGDLPNRVRASGASIVVATSMPTALAIKSLDIPALFFAPRDPIAHGLVDSIQRPGGLMTGYVSRPPSIAKMMELAVDVAPRIKRVAVVTENMLSRDEGQGRASAQDGAARFGLSAEMFIIEERDAFEQFLDRRLRSFDALVMPWTRRPYEHFDYVIGELRRRRVIAILGSARQIRSGGLIGLYPDFDDSADVIARQLEALLLGVPPGEIPVERSRLFRLSINLSTAREIGMQLSAALIKRADVLVG